MLGLPTGPQRSAHASPGDPVGHWPGAFDQRQLLGRGLAARLAGLPSIYHVHDLTLGRTLASAIFAGTILAVAADRIVCVSNAAQRALPLKSINLSKSIVLHNAVDPEEFHPTSRSDRLCGLNSGSSQTAW